MRIRWPVSVLGFDTVQLPIISIVSDSSIGPWSILQTVQLFIMSIVQIHCAKVKFAVMWLWVKILYLYPLMNNKRKVLLNVWLPNSLGGWWFVFHVGHPTKNHRNFVVQNHHGYCWCAFPNNCWPTFGHTQPLSPSPVSLVGYHPCQTTSVSHHQPL